MVLLSERGREYRQEVHRIAAENDWNQELEQRLSVHVDAWPPDLRKRDLDNLFKSTLDALVYADVMLDDSQIDHLSITRHPKLTGGRLYVHIEERDERDQPARGHDADPGRRTRNASTGSNTSEEKDSETPKQKEAFCKAPDFCVCGQCVPF